MSSNSSTGSFLPSTAFQSTSWDKKDIIIFLVNGALLAFVAICGSKLVYEMLNGGRQNQDELWITMILTGTAYLYSLIVAKFSINTLEKKRRVTNISRIIWFYGILYCLGVVLIYWIIIYKLAERDYSSWRYLQYILILVMVFFAAKLFISIPNIRDIWTLSSLVLLTNIVHISSIIYQYVICGACHYTYFFMDLAILTGMAIAALYTLFVASKVQ